MSLDWMWNARIKELFRVTPKFQSECWKSGVDFYRNTDNCRRSRFIREKLEIQCEDFKFEMSVECSDGEFEQAVGDISWDLWGEPGLAVNLGVVIIQMVFEVMRLVEITQD